MKTYNRDDWLAVFNEPKTHQQMEQWMKGFQKKVNTLAEGDYMQFTCSMWTPGANTGNGTTSKVRR